MKKQQLNTQDIDRIIEMAWEDRTPFSAIEFQFGLTEQEVIRLMQRELKPSSWKRWRKRVHQQSIKHEARRLEDVTRFKCSRQRIITGNRISKRK